MGKKARMGGSQKRVKSRIGKTNRVPKTRASKTWTEAAFWGFIRSGLRRMSRRWRPLVQDALNTARRPSQSKKNPRLKWQFNCAKCGGWFSRKNVEVDHIVEVGTLSCAAEAGAHIERLFCEVDGLQVLCKKCHARKTKAHTKSRFSAKVTQRPGLHN